MEIGDNRVRLDTGWRGSLILGRLRRVRRIAVHLLIYAVLAEFAFVFLVPLLYMFSTSAKSIEAYLDSTVGWVPPAIHWPNFLQAIQAMHLPEALFNSLLIAGIACAGQVLSCSAAGYGFGRYKFFGDGFLLALVLLTLIVPPQTIIISLFSLFHKLGWINTYYPFIVPAFFAQGLRGALFILIFRQFFRGLPREMEEAARVDGAGAFRVFRSIMLPLARPALFVVAIFSFVWHWNDSYEPAVYLNRESLFTLPIRLESLGITFKSMFGSNAELGLNEPITMAAALIVVAPMLVLYMFSQRFLTEGIERTGIVE